MTRPEERQLAGIRDMIAAGKPARTVLGLICGMLRCPVPDIKGNGWVKSRDAGKPAHTHVAPRVTPDNPLALSPEELRGARGRELVQPIAKPSRRVVAKDVVADFRATHTRCCVLGCPNGDADPHHIWPRGRGGPDQESNLMPLCPGPMGHHEEIEHIDAEAFAAKYASRLPPTILLKIKLALMLEAEHKLGQREAIDLDADTLDMEEA